MATVRVAPGPGRAAVTAARSTAPDTALQLVGAVLAVRLHAELSRPDLARAGLNRCLDLLADLDDALPHHPPPALAGAGPRHIEESRP